MSGEPLVQLSVEQNQTERLTSDELNHSQGGDLNHSKGGGDKFQDSLGSRKQVLACKHLLLDCYKGY